ncbi:GntP family gluconate:H+ symporter [Actinoalloteichus hoggarensis]|uniref:High-affinity gluconate transporter n=1 Tax=Actinoalloteichus hoggarensis TaxID=1470176 RepID=A0A221W3A3_9PSEU|nr:GntP family permease [Actinoalloteichus hoggarensis]ASO20320.1 High-affinity gluconate transporter [Actinoalloteichus hoggarensis]MBB5923358.1 GntP family gluconate:H+ symporter [Actinoalloteichus hoggarensis]
MSDVYTLVAFGTAILLLVLMIARFKVHPVPTLFVIVTALGLALGMGGLGTIEIITEGFGSTLASVGLLVIFGCVLGKMLELGGAALRITEEAERLLPGKKLPWGIALASMVIGIPLIADTVVLMLIPIVSVMAHRTGISMMKLGPILYLGAYVFTSTMPPGPGPLAATSLLGVEIGQALLWGFVVGFPGILVATFYLLRTKTHVDPKPEYIADLGLGSSGAGGTGDGVDTRPKTSLTLSLIPVLFPISVIILASFLVPVLGEESTGGQVLGFLGEPVVALFLGCVSALPLFGRRWHRKEVLSDVFEQGLKLAAMPIAVTGIGGALAQIIRATGVAESVAGGIETVGISPIFVPFLVAAAVCTITGSNILGVMTAAAIMQPLIETLGLSPLAVYLACATGAQIMKHANSSGFWVTTTLSNMTVGQGIKSIGVASVLSGITGFIVLNVLLALGAV